MCVVDLELQGNFVACRLYSENLLRSCDFLGEELKGERACLRMFNEIYENFLFFNFRKFRNQEVNLFLCPKIEKTESFV